MPADSRHSPFFVRPDFDREQVLAVNRKSISKQKHSSKQMPAECRLQSAESLNRADDGHGARP